MLEYLYSGSDGDAEAAFDAALIEAAARDIPTYLSAYSGVYEDQWVRDSTHWHPERFTLPTRCSRSVAVTIAGSW